MDKTPLITACAESGALVSRQKDGLGARFSTKNLPFGEIPNAALLDLI